MKCYCDVSHGGAGKINTPYTYHLYICEFYLDECANYSYEEFKCDYEKMESEKKSQDDIYKHFMGMLTKIKQKMNINILGNALYMKNTILFADIEKKNRLRLTKKQALDMELALNLSEYATKWCKIGDHLFNFHVGKMEDDLFVTTEQFVTLVSFLSPKTD